MRNMSREAAAAMATVLSLSVGTMSAAMAQSAQAASRGSGPGRAGASKPLGANDQFYATITNVSKWYSWVPKTNPDNTNLTSGTWVTYPVVLPPGHTGEAFWSQGGQGSWAGTGGYVTYQLGDDPSTWFRINFDVPYVGANSCSVDTSSDHVLVQTSGCPSVGTTESASFKVGIIS
jgi:hypothetical protein